MVWITDYHYFKGMCSGGMLHIYITNSRYTYNMNKINTEQYSDI